MIKNESSVYAKQLDTFYIFVYIMMQLNWSKPTLACITCFPTSIKNAYTTYTNTTAVNTSFSAHCYETFRTCCSVDKGHGPTGCPGTTNGEEIGDLGLHPSQFCNICGLKIPSEITEKHVQPLKLKIEDTPNSNI